MTVGDEAAGCALVMQGGGALFVDDALYFWEPQITLGRRDLTTGASTTLVGDVFATFGFALDPMHVYFASLPDPVAGGTLRIERVPRLGGALELLLDDPPSDGEGVDRLRIVEGQLFYRTVGLFGPGPLNLVDPGTGATPVLNGTEIHDYAADATHLYYLEGTGTLATAIGRASLATLETVETLVANAGSFSEEMALLGDRVYWLDDGSLRSVPKAGGTPEPVHKFADISSIGHADEAALYVVERTEELTHVYRQAGTGSAPVRLASVLNGVGLNLPGVTTDATHAYVSARGAVLRVTK
jgi:hypothetical protein